MALGGVEYIGDAWEFGRWPSDRLIPGGASMRVSSVTSRVFVLTAAIHLLPVAPPALAQTDIHSEEQKLTAMDAVGGESFGFSVAVRSNRAIVGAPRDDGIGNQSGSATVFRHSPVGAIWL